MHVLTRRQPPPPGPQDEIADLRQRIAEQEQKLAAAERFLEGFDDRAQASPDTYDAQIERINAQAELAKLRPRLEYALLVAAEQHAAAGEKTYQQVDRQFKELEDLRRQHLDAIEVLDARVASTAHAAKTELAPWPEHYSKIIRAHVKYRDEAVDVLEAREAYAQKLAAIGGTIAKQDFCTKYRLPVKFLTVDPFSDTSFDGVYGQSLTQWLEQHIAAEQP